MTKEIENRVYWLVCTANPDPDLQPVQVYEIERGEFDNEIDASTLARELQAMGESVQVFKSFRVNAPAYWLRGDGQPL